jgi:hypothetical protein
MQAGIGDESEMGRRVSSFPSADILEVHDRNAAASLFKEICRSNAGNPPSDDKNVDFHLAAELREVMAIHGVDPKGLLLHDGVVTRVANRGDEGCGCPMAFCSRSLGGMAVPRRSVVRPPMDGRKILLGMTEGFE